MNLQIRKNLPIIICSFIGTSGLAFSTIMPVLLGGIVDQLEFARSMVGWLASINIMGIAIGGVIATLLIGKFSFIRIVRTGLIGLVLFDFACIFVHEENVMLGLRLCSGICGGLVYAGTMAAFSGLKDALRAFGTYVVVYCLWSFIGLLGASWLIANVGIGAAFALLAGIELFSLSLSSTFYRLSTEIKERKIVSLRYLLSNKWVMISLLAYLAMHTGGGTIWAYLERIAKEAALSESFTGISLGLSRLVSLAGAFVVIRLGNRVKVKSAIILTLSIMALGMLLLFIAEIPAIYVLAISLFGGGWSVAIPYFQKIQSQYDPQGKVVSMGTIVNMGGRSIGPAIAALVLGSSAFVNVIWIGLGVLALSFVLMISTFAR